MATDNSAVEVTMLALGQVWDAQRDVIIHAHAMGLVPEQPPMPWAELGFGAQVTFAANMAGLMGEISGVMAKVNALARRGRN